ncbi:MAG: hypothetical protein AMXMBFR53_09280 [Gemmatimonadota bacterium]
MFEGAGGDAAEVVDDVRAPSPRALGALALGTLDGHEADPTCQLVHRGEPVKWLARYGMEDLTPLIGDRDPRSRGLRARLATGDENDVPSPWPDRVPKAMKVGRVPSVAIRAFGAVQMRKQDRPQPGRGAEHHAVNRPDTAEPHDPADLRSG